MSAAKALQAAIFARLSGDAALLALLGPGRIRDRLLEREERPMLALLEIESRDWSTSTEPGEEHVVAIEARCGEGGHRLVQEIAACVRLALHDATLVLAGHKLVNLRLERTKTARDAATQGHVAAMQFRAVTEPWP